MDLKKSNNFYKCTYTVYPSICYPSILLSFRDISGRNVCLFCYNILKIDITGPIML